MFRTLVTHHGLSVAVDHPISGLDLNGEIAAAFASAPMPPASLSPSISIIIPTRDRLELLAACLASVRPALTPQIDIIIVDNGSAAPETLAFFDQIQREPRMRVIKAPGPFNFSLLSNEGAKASKADVLVFLNNDVTAIDAAWLGKLAFLALDPQTGAVGARLLYPSGRLQHSGIILGLGGHAGHIELGLDPNDPGIFGRAKHDHRLMAVTGACLAVERAKFEAVGGFDAINLPVDLNDVDLCLRLYERGWPSVLASEAVLIHHESASRGRHSRTPRYAGERAYFRKRWGALMRDDPHYHPALSLLVTKPLLG